MTHPFMLSTEETLKEFKTRKDGLKTPEVATIKAQVGLNTIPKPKRSFYERYIKSTFNLMIIILLLAAVIQILLGETFNGVAILVILAINTLIAMVQQFRTERTLEALERISSFKATVLRDGQPQKIEAYELVPGDILVLKQGDHISADARLIEASELSIDESVLTGESVPVNKIIERITEQASTVQQQKNMVFNSTFVTSGNAKAVVVATGANTEIGKISKGIATMEEREIPLRKQMGNLAKGMGILVLAVVFILFIYQLVFNIINDIPITVEVFRQNLGWLVSLAVAAIPFHFPLITTIILLTGVLQLARKQAIVRNLTAVETLGRISVVCSDKTGTLTKNQMTVKKIYFNGQNYDVSGEGYDPVGQIQLNKTQIKEKENPLLLEMLSSGVINNISELVQENVKIRKGSLKVTKIIGMPTEGALLTLAMKAGLNLQQVRQHYQVVKQFNFTSDRKRMSTIVKVDGKSLIFTKGAPEVLLKLCNNTVLNNNIIPITQDQIKEISKRIEMYANTGLRVLAFAFKQFSSGDLNAATVEDSEKNLTFMGMVAMLDPPREGVKESVQICNEAGIRVVMITGDFPITAKSIAKELGIWKEGDLIVEGNQIKDLSPDDITKVSVFARVAPEHKQLIIKDFQEKNQVVAMTGDGVNDALALENADVGVAMGITGTDVAKSASDLILTDDSFTTMETALYHGRGLFNNIRSDIMYLLVCNLMELTILTLLSLVLNLELFSSIQLIVIYITVQFFIPIVLMFDKYDRDIMKDKPKRSNEPILSKSYIRLLILQIFTFSMVIIILWLLIYYDIIPLYPENYQDFQNAQGVGFSYGQGVYKLVMELEARDLRIMKAQAVCMITLFFSEVWIALESRSEHHSIFHGPANFVLYAVLVLVLALLYALMQWDYFHAYLLLTGLNLYDWAFGIGASLIPVIVIEIYKKL